MTVEPPPADYYEYGPELQRARDWAADAGLHMSVLLGALSVTEACLASASKSLEAEFKASNRLRAELDRYRQVITEYVNEVESGEKFDALLELVPGLLSDDDQYGEPNPKESA